MLFVLLIPFVCVLLLLDDHLALRRFEARRQRWPHRCVRWN